MGDFHLVAEQPQKHRQGMSHGGLVVHHEDPPPDARTT
jgi:hypothetical protein